METVEAIDRWKAESIRKIDAFDHRYVERLSEYTNAQFGHRISVGAISSGRNQIAILY